MDRPGHDLGPIEPTALRIHCEPDPTNPGNRHAVVYLRQEPIATFATRAEAESFLCGFHMGRWDHRLEALFGASPAPAGHETADPTDARQGPGS